MLHRSCGVQHSSSDPFLHRLWTNSYRTPHVAICCVNVLHCLNLPADSNCSIHPLSSSHKRHDGHTVTLMFAALWWKFPSKHSVTSHPSNSSLWDPVTLFSSLPTALTAWIKSTVTCVTTSPILLQTWGEYRFSSSPLPLRCSGQMSEPAGSLPCWHIQYGRLTEQTLKTSQWKVTWGNLLILPKHKAMMHTMQIWFSLLFFTSACFYSAKNKICGACTTTFTLNRWVFPPQHVFGCLESWYYFANMQGLATASQDGLGDF